MMQWRIVGSMAKQRIPGLGAAPTQYKLLSIRQKSQPSVAQEAKILDLYVKSASKM